MKKKGRRGAPAIRIRAAAAIVRGGEILLVEHEKNGKRYWLLPGGGVEFGEEIRSAAAREVREETGLRVKVGRLFLVSESIPPDRHRHVLNMTFVATLIGGRLRKKPPADEPVLIGFAWKPIASLPKLPFYPQFQREILAAWRHRFRGPVQYLGNRWNR